MKIFSMRNFLGMLFIVFFAVNMRKTTANAEMQVSFMLPAEGKYTASVLGKTSDGKAHRSFVGIDILKLGETNSAEYMKYSMIDIPVVKGTPIYAVADGVVYKNRYYDAGGWVVVLKHTEEDGSISYSYYGHMQSQGDYMVGETVRCGDMVGRSGNSGVGSGPHIHFEWSGHDVYCEFRKMGIDLSILNNSGASCYPHVHEMEYTARVTGTDGSLALNSQMKSGTMKMAIPEGALVVINPDKSSNAWLYTTYQNQSGYCYYKYLVKTEDGKETVQNPVSNCYTAYVTGTDGKLAINSKKASGYQIATVPECAAVLVNPDKSTSTWLYTTYNGVSGYCYYKYLTTNVPYSYTGTIRNTSGALAINATASTKYRIGVIPEGAQVTVFGNKRVGNWVWVCYNGIYGYSYSRYIK